MKWPEPKWSLAIRLLAIALFTIVGAAVVISYRQQHHILRRRGAETKEASLSARLVSVSENIRHLQAQDGRPLFLLTAARDEVYDDGHHELSDVSVTLYAADASERARITARRAVYYQTSGLVIFATDVRAWTREGLRFQTEELRYDQATEILRTERPVTFEHASGWGESQGAEVHLRRDQRSRVFLQTVRFGIAPMAPDSSEPWNGRAAAATFEGATLTFRLTGDVVIARDADELRADRLEGVLDRAHRVRHFTAEGNVRFHSRTEQTTVEIVSQSLMVSLTERRAVSRAVAIGSVLARFRDRTDERELRGPRVEITFVSSRNALVPQFARAEGGRVSLALRDGAPDRRTGERRVEADRLEAFFRTETRALARLRASGNVRVEIPPTSSAKTAERTTIWAQEAELTFDGEKNRATLGRASGDIRVRIEPVDASATSSQRLTTSATLLVEFDPKTRGIARLLQSGRFRYVEGDRRAESERAIYEADSGWIRLRGGDPTVWDARGRTRADEVDMNVREERSVARGRVVTTILPREAMARALPFAERDAPIFIAADRLEADHRARRVRYTGAVRAWQQDTYLATEALELDEAGRTLNAYGRVRSFLFRAPRVEGGRAEAVPIFVSAARLSYCEAERKILYEGEVSLQRGAQRLLAESLTVFMKPDVAEIERALAERRVTLMEPERRAYAERATYDAASARIVLEGAPARVEDDRHGVRQQGARLTFQDGGDKVLIEDGEGARRVKTVRTIPRGKP
ncbi:MAG: LPS export ABC transporter periplasmic protein LptC [Acidobacteriota bacterium]|nr:LPS export ABC transporter periplasmic protein LptC [Acidobacteriota bacterium]